MSEWYFSVHPQQTNYCVWAWQYEYMQKQNRRKRVKQINGINREGPTPEEALRLLREIGVDDEY